MNKHLGFDDFIESQEPKYRILMNHIRKLAASSHEQMREKSAFNTLFFHCFDYVFYFGRIDKKHGLEIGFVKGFLLSNDHGLLETKNRKLIRGISFLDLEDFMNKEEVFLETLQEAILLNEIQPENTFQKMIFEKRKK